MPEREHVQAAGGKPSGLPESGPPLHHLLHHLLLQVRPEDEFPTVAGLARSAENAGWAALLVGGVHDSITLLAGIAPLTRRIGLVAGIDPLVVPPYTAARRLASLDHISGGRAGWRLLGDAAPEIQADFAAAVRALWDSWGEDAHRIDKESGRYIDIAAVKRVDYHGPYYRTAGPLDVPRPVQGYPVHYGSLPETRPDVLLAPGAQAASIAGGSARTALRLDAGAWDRDRHSSRTTPHAHDLVVELPTALATGARLQLPAAGRPAGDGAVVRLRDRLGLPLPATGTQKDFPS